MVTRVRYLVIFFLVCTFLSGIIIAVILNTDFGNVEVKIISITNVGKQISGLLYRPREATAENPLPAVVLVHGISTAKETVSGIALELARRSFVALAVDLLGHGDSGGRMSGSEPTLGTLATVLYLESQPFVKASAIGLVGHSLGAGAIRATAVAHRNITASVFIGGGLGGMLTDPAYGTLNSTFPKNLLIAIGTHDILFNLDRLETESLLSVFGTSQKIVPVSLYGDFSSQTARKLVTPETIHLFEPLDPTIVSETVVWMNEALKIGGQYDSRPLGKNLIYLYREGAIIVSLIAFISLIFPISETLFDLPQVIIEKEKPKTELEVLEGWKILAIWGGLGLGLYLPMLVAGSLIPFPPLIFGSSIAWWLLTAGIVGLVILYLISKFSKAELNLKSKIFESFDPKYTIMAVSMFLLLYLISYLIESIFIINLRIIVPIFNDLKFIKRFFMFLMFIPFFLVYFLAEGLYLHEYRSEMIQKSGCLPNIIDLIRVIGIKISPYIVILCLQYVPMLVLNVRIFQSYLGFFIEFIWAIIPLFIISTAYSLWFYRKTSTIGVGVIFNSLIFAWISASLFPF